MPLFDRKLRICFEGFCRIANSYRGLRRVSPIRHAPQVPTENRPNATENRPNAPFLCHLATLLRHLETLLRTFVQDTKVDLRRIVSDFLTDRVRVGAPADGQPPVYPKLGQSCDVPDIIAMHGMPLARVRVSLLGI